MDYEVIVIGGGPAGYVAAIRCAQLGLNTACIDQWRNEKNQPALGGTCLNVGCIPSKALLESSEHFEFTRQHSKDFGINITKVEIDVKAMIARKDKIVTQLTAGIPTLFKANKVTWLAGSGQYLANKKVKYTAHNGKSETLTAANIIIATGSIPVKLPNMPLVKNLVVDSTGALNFNQVPKNLCVIGAGVIGLELGSVWRRLGAKVSVLELGEFLPTMDKKIAKVALSSLKKQGLIIKTGVNVDLVSTNKTLVTVKYTELKTEKFHTEIFDKVIVAVGRKPNSSKVLAADSGLTINQFGQIEVTQFCQTKIAGVYAIGDVVRGLMLAHKASEEGIMVAERITLQQPQLNYDHIPMVVYTEPEIASVGKTEAELKDLGIKYNSGEFQFIANGRAKTANNTTGFIKILADANTDAILGVHMIGAKVSELIAIAVVAMELEGSAEDLSRTIFAHPSLSEAIHEAALAVNKVAIHAINKP